MGNYSAAERAKLPATAFCGPDRSFPVLDEADARKAWNLAGHADRPDAVRSCVKRKAKSHGWKLPDTANMSGLPVTGFAPDEATLPVRFAVGGGVTRRTGKIFECGDYPDKEFTLDEQEADAAIAAFAPVHADYEHKSGPLDGKLGRLIRVWREGKSLFGEVELPDWLDGALEAGGRKLSLAWSHAPEKRIVGWGWVRTPRVSDASLFAAFSAHEANFAGARHSTSDQRSIQAAHDALHDGHDHLLHAGAECLDSTVLGYPVRMSAPGTDPEALSPRKEHMFMDEIKGMLADIQQRLSGGRRADTTFTGESGAEKPTVPPAVISGTTTLTVPPPAVPDEVTRRITGLETALQAERDARLADRVAGFSAQARAEVEAFVAQHRVMPGEVEALVVSFAQNLVDDLVNPKTVTFSTATGTEQVSRAEATRRGLRARVPHGLTTEQIPVTVVAFDQDGKRKEEKVDILTPEGAEEFARGWAAKANRAGNGAGAHRN